MIITEFSFEAKLLRAKQHLHALEREIKGWLATQPYSKTGEFDSHTGEHIVWAEVIGDMPNDISLLVGDCIFNFRACLDHLAYSLAVAHTGEPLPADMAKASEFPICNHPDWYRRDGPRKIRGIVPAAQTVIERLQPYNSGNGWENHALWVLSDLSNIDKHRKLHILLISLVDTALPMLPNVYTQWLDIAGPCAIKGKTQIAHYKARTLDQRAAVQVNILTAFDIAFERPPLDNFPVVTTLRQISAFVEHTVIKQLRPFLSSPP